MAYTMESVLSIEEAVAILNDKEINHVSKPMMKPKAKQYYIFKSNNPLEKDDWRADGYRWRSRGVCPLPKSDPIVTKRYFDVDTANGSSSEFQRHAYQLVGNSSATLVQYLGNESIACDFAHRGSKRDRPFIRTAPSTMTRLSNLVTTNTASNVYKKEVSSMSCDGEVVCTQVPRDMKQLRNMRYDKLHQSRISQDSLYNIHEIAYNVPGFVWRINTYPDLVVIFGLQEVLDEFDKVINLKHGRQLISYDTTFQMGDFYVSSMLFRHTIFSECPVIPAMFMIHERKFAETHCCMISECASRVKSLQTYDHSFVTDREKAIVKAVQSKIPNTCLFYCWNHIQQDIKMWLRRHGAPGTEISIYLEDCNSLFRSKDKESYEIKLQKFETKWDETFLEYYKSEIDADIEFLARWKLDEKGLFNAYSGITNNQSEALNRVYKDLIQWKEAPLDCIVLSMYQLQAFYVNEIKRGFSGLGQYSLNSVFKSLQEAPELFTYIPTQSPEDIVCSIRNSNSEEIASQLHVHVDTKKDACEQTGPLTNDVMLSSLARARLILSSGSITYDSKLRVFNVLGSGSSVHIVSLFPKSKCSCPAVSPSCCHIIAAKLYLGMDVKDEKESQRILSQLRKNVRKKRETKGGRKRPRTRDTDNNEEESVGKKCDSDREKEELINEDQTVSKRVLYHLEPFQMTHEHMHQMLNREWIHAEVVDFYMKLLVVKYSTKDLVLATLPSHFLDLFMKTGTVSKELQLLTDELFVKGILFLPLFLKTRNHFVLLVVDFANKEISLLDSITNPQFRGTQFHTTNIKKPLSNECKKRNLPVDLTHWTENLPEKIAQQGNGTSCGLFVCKYAKCYALKQSLDFTVTDDKLLRKEIALEIAQWSVFGYENMAGHCNTCGLPFVFEELSYHTPYCHTTELHDTQLTTAENNLKKATTSTCTSISSLKQPAKDNFKINGTVFTSSSILEDNHKKAIVSPSSTTKEHVKKKRRRRCQKCAGCTAPDCGKCAFCLDMVKFGGQGIRRQCCKERNCLELSDNTGPQTPNLPANKLKAPVQPSLRVENDDLQPPLSVATNNEDGILSMKVRKQNTLQNMCMEFKNVFHKYVTLSENDNFIELDINKGKIGLSKKDVDIIYDNKWLNDKIINFYMTVLNNSQEISLNTCISRTRTYCLQTFFYEAVLDGKGAKFIKCELQQTRRLICPVNMKGSHWILIIIDLGKRLVKCLDPLEYKEHNQILDNICKAIEETYMTCYGKKRNISMWKRFSNENRTLQCNMVDCGVFVCKYSEAIIHSKDLIFDNDSMYLRTWLVKELINCETISQYQWKIPNINWITMTNELAVILNEEKIKSFHVKEFKENGSYVDDDVCNSDLTSADEEDYSELAIIAPTFPGEEAEDNDDFSIVSREKSYVDVATNFFKVSHPPIRIGSLLVINYFQALKSNEGIFIEIIKSPRCSSFYHSNILHKTKHMPDTIWPLSDDVISQQIFMYLEELTALHCPHGNLRKAIAVHLLWPEAMITYISMDKKISKDDATMLYKDELGLI